MKNHVFQILGFNDEVTTCDLCGKQELKGTYALQEYDATGGPVGPVVRFGSTCGRKAAGWTVSEWNRKATAAVVAQKVAAMLPLAQKIAAEAKKQAAQLPEPVDLGPVNAFSKDRWWGPPGFEKNGPRVNVASWEPFGAKHRDLLEWNAYHHFLLSGIEKAGFPRHSPEARALLALAHADTNKAEREFRS
jgi:hypothetical protein